MYDTKKRKIKSKAVKPKKAKQPEIVLSKKSKNKNSSLSPQLVPSVSEGGNALQNYLARISKIPLLSREEEFELAKSYYENKDPEMAKQLVQANLRFVVKVVAEYSKFSSKVMDLIQEGNIGLVKAVQEFNPYKGAKLITYAVWWIRGYIQDYLMKQHSIVRLGTNKKQQKLFYLLQREKQNLDHYTGSRLIPVIAKETQTTLQDVEEMKELVLKKDFSLDQSISNEGGTTFLDLQADNAFESLDEGFSLQQMSQLLKKQLKKLEKDFSEKENKIIQDRLLKSPPKTLQKIADEFHVTREAIRQTEERLMKKLRKKLIPILKKPY